MKEFFKQDRWSPYLVGILIGLLLTLLLTAGYTIGVSTAVARAGALIENIFAAKHLEKTPYFRALLSDKVILDWKILFIIGIFLGSFIASKLAPKSKLSHNTVWVRQFGVSPRKRKFFAFIGGIFLLFGARVANGCTSGHAISGGAQLSLTSWVFMLSLFAVGIPTSMYIYSKSRRTT